MKLIRAYVGNAVSELDVDAVTYTTFVGACVCS